MSNPYTKLHSRREAADLALTISGTFAALALIVLYYSSGMSDARSLQDASLIVALSAGFVALMSWMFSEAIASEIEELIERRIESRPEHRYGGRVAEMQLAAPWNTLLQPDVPTAYGDVAMDIRRYTGINSFELDHLLRGMDEQQRRLASRALIERAYALTRELGPAAARTELTSTLDHSEAARIVQAAAAQSD